MAKLYFKYGVVNSSKSANALMTIHNYEEQGMSVYTMKSSIDTRDYNVIKSRAIGSKREVDMLLVPESDIVKIFNYASKTSKIDVIIVDECQFLTVRQIDSLREIVDDYGVPVICYGLKTDFRTHLFESSKRLLELADSVQEIKTVCSCGSKAIFNAKLDSSGNVILGGNQIKIGGNETYTPVCSKCYRKRLKHSDTKSSSKVCKMFMKDKDYLLDLVKRLEKKLPDDRGILLNEVICADYYVSKLMSEDTEGYLTSELSDIKKCFNTVLETATAHDLLVAQKRASNRR